MAPPPSWEVELDSAFSVEEVSVVRSVDFGGLKALLKGLLGGLYKEQDDLKQELSDTKARLKELEDKAGQAGPPAAPVSTQEAATAPAAVTQPASAQQPATDPAAAAAPAAQADVGPSPDQEQVKHLEARVAALEQQQQQLKPRLEALEAQQGTATPPAAPAAAAAATPAAAAGAAEKAAAEKPAPADAAVPAPAAQAVAAPPSGGDLGPQLQALAGKVAALEAAVQQLDTQQQQQQQQQQQGQTGQQPPVVPATGATAAADPELLQQQADLAAKQQQLAAQHQALAAQLAELAAAAAGQAAGLDQLRAAVGGKADAAAVEGLAASVAGAAPAAELAGVWEGLREGLKGKADKGEVDALLGLLQGGASLGAPSAAAGADSTGAPSASPAAAAAAGVLDAAGGVDPSSLVEALAGQAAGLEGVRLGLALLTERLGGKADAGELGELRQGLAAARTSLTQLANDALTTLPGLTSQVNELRATLTDLTNRQVPGVAGDAAAAKAAADEAKAGLGQLAAAVEGLKKAGASGSGSGSGSAPAADPGLASKVQMLQQQIIMVQQRLGGLDSAVKMISSAASSGTGRRSGAGAAVAAPATAPSPAAAAAAAAAPAGASSSAAAPTTTKSSSSSSSSSQGAASGVALSGAAGGNGGDAAVGAELEELAGRLAALEGMLQGLLLEQLPALSGGLASLQLEVGCKAEVAALEGLAAALGDKADKEELGRVRLGLAQAAQQADVDQLRHQLAATAAQLAGLAQQLLSDPPAPTTPTAASPAIPPAVAAAMAAAADLRPGTAAVGLGREPAGPDSSNGRGRGALQNVNSFGGWVPAPALQAGAGGFGGGSGAPSPAGSRLGGSNARAGDGLGALGLDDIQSALDQLAHAVALLAVGSNNALPGGAAGEGQDAAGSGRAAAAAGGARGLGGGTGVSAVPGAALRHLGRLLDQGLVGHKMDAFDPKLLQKMAQRLAAAESALRRSQPGATPGGAPDQAQKQADQLRRLAADVRSLKERLGGPGGLAGDGGRALAGGGPGAAGVWEGDHAVLSSKPLLGYRCMACDRPLPTLDERPGPYIPAGRMPPPVPSGQPAAVGGIEQIKAALSPRSAGGLSGEPSPTNPGRRRGELSPLPGDPDKRGPQHWYGEKHGPPAEALPVGDVGPHLPPGGWRGSMPRAEDGSALPQLPKGRGGKHNG